MMVAKLPALTPTESRTPPSGEPSSQDGEAFASVLKEKTGAQPNLPAGHPVNAQAANFPPAAEAETEKSDSSDTSDVDAALLSLLNMTLPAVTENGEAKNAKLPLSADRDDAATAATTASDPQPLPLIANVDILAQPTAAQPDTPLDSALEGADAAPISSALNASQAAAPAMVKNSYHPALQAHFSTAFAAQSALKPTEPAEQSQLEASPPLKNAAQPLTSASLALKGEAAVHAEEPNVRALEPAMPITAEQQVSRAGENEPLQNSGVLTETMGTPAWQQSMGQQIACFARNGVQHAELRLHPEELGSLQITLQLKNEQAQLHFVSESHQVRAAIEAAVPHLRTSLAEAGIELGQSSIGADTSSSWQHSGDSSQQARQNFTGQTPQDERTLPEEHIENVARTVVYNNGINTFA